MKEAIHRFEFELTPNLQFGMPQNLVIGVEDKGGNDRLAGKQGYGNARGIWQTVYLEARGNDYIDYVHFTPDIDRSAVKVQVGLNGVPAKDATIRIKFKNGEQTDFTYQPKGKAKKSTVQEFEIPVVRPASLGAGRPVSVRNYGQPVCKRTTRRTR